MKSPRNAVPRAPGAAGSHQAPGGSTYGFPVPEGKADSERATAAEPKRATRSSAAVQPASRAQRIRERAFARHESRQGASGDATVDWIEAEAEILDEERKAAGG